MTRTVLAMVAVLVSLSATAGAAQAYNNNSSSSAPNFDVVTVRSDALNGFSVPLYEDCPGAEAVTITDGDTMRRRVEVRNDAVRMGDYSYTTVGTLTGVGGESGADYTVVWSRQYIERSTMNGRTLDVVETWHVIAAGNGGVSWTSTNDYSSTFRNGQSTVTQSLETRCH